MRALFVSLGMLLAQVAFTQESFTDDFGITFIQVPPGKFTYGKFSPPFPVPADEDASVGNGRMMWMGDEHAKRYSEQEYKLARTLAVKDAKPGFEVEFKRSFYIGKFEVTQGQWKKVMGKNPSVFKFDSLGNSDDLPVQNITWDEAQRFITKLNRRDSRRRYRLPTEFEWEYAARAGRKGDVPWDEISKMANLNKTHPLPVGSMAPNAWGIHDMLGNVWEWMSEWYNEKIFAESRPPEEGTTHVLKGGSFVSDVKNATYMTHAGGPGNGWDVGFRLVLEIDEE